MPDQITITGLVATAPRHIVTSEGLPITSFRVASTQRRFDRAKEAWIDGETNWYTITGFRQLALNTAGSLAKGDRVLIAGRLKIRDWENGDRSGTTIEIEADSIGHDLMWGTASFTRSISAASAAAADPAAEAFPDTAPEDAASADVTAPTESEGALVSAESVAVPF